MTTTDDRSRALKTDESIKIPSTCLRFIANEAIHRGMYKRNVLAAMVELWRSTGERQRQRAILKFGRRRVSDLRATGL